MRWGMMVKVQNAKINYYATLYQAGLLDDQTGDHNAPEEVRYLAELAGRARRDRALLSAPPRRRWGLVRPSRWSMGARATAGENGARGAATGRGAPRRVQRGGGFARPLSRVSADHGLAELSELGADNVEGMVNALRAGLEGDNALLHCRRHTRRVISLNAATCQKRPRRCRPRPLEGDSIHG